MEYYRAVCIIGFLICKKEDILSFFVAVEYGRNWFVYAEEIREVENSMLFACEAFMNLPALDFLS
jgi:hypothetical protein